MKSQPLSMNELKEAFLSIKMNKSPEKDEVSFNIIQKCFGQLCELLKYLFNLTFQRRVCPDDLRIAKVTPIYKTDSSSDVSNYGPIFVLPCFSKIFERIMSFKNI